MKWDDAQAWLERRAAVAHGLAPDDPASTIVLEGVTPEEQARMILSGLIEGDDLESAIEKLSGAAANLMTNLVQNAALGLHAQAGSVYTFLVQILASGILLAQDREVVL